MSKLLVPHEASRTTADPTVAQVEPAATVPASHERPLVDQILDQIQPLIASQRKAVAHHGCFRAISSTHLHVLFLLDSDGPMPMGRLAELLDVSLPNVTGIVDRMEEKGLVERGRDASDRRLVTLAATQHGRETIEEIDQVRRRTLASVLEKLTPEQQDRALRTFTEMGVAAQSVHNETPDPQRSAPDAH